ncbi:26499_t:CDS:2, partial [Racocetra persica]
ANTHPPEFILFNIFDSEVLADDEIEVLVDDKAKAEAKESGDYSLSNYIKF